MQFALLLLAVYSVLPAQLVWCHEDGRIPRMEAGFNGQCVSVSADCCCGPTVDLPVATSVPSSTGFSAGHSHCMDCSDETAHVQQATRSVQAFGATGAISGGVLYALPATAFASPIMDISKLAVIDRHKPPGLSSLQLPTTHLLM